MHKYILSQSYAVEYIFDFLLNKSHMSEFRMSIGKLHVWGF